MNSFIKGEKMIPLSVLLPKVFAFFVIVVGGYVWMFLNVMRTDPREQEFRKYSGQDNGLIPKQKKKNKE